VPDAPIRVAFLGPAAAAGVHALHAPAGGLEPHFFDVRPGTQALDLRTQLLHFAPHAVVALEPSVVPPRALDGLGAATLAVGTADGFDRVLGVPGVNAAFWRSRPLPIDDRLFADVRSSHHAPRALFLGESSPHREGLLIHAKHGYDVQHYAHGLSGEALIQALAAADVGIALNPTPEPGFPPHMPLHLAAGHLLLAERPTPSCGLEAGIDYLEFDSHDGLLGLLYQVKLRPDADDLVRVRGRLKAEEHRASRVWPRIVGDLLADVAAFG
jgi:hypothetical protein